MTRARIQLTALAGLVGLALTGCATDDLDDPAEVAGEQPGDEPDEAAADEPCPLDGDRRVVNAECVDPWPLTVEQGEAWCDRDLPYVDAAGTTWGLTGAAYSQGEGQELDDSIWADNPDIEGTKINVSALRDAALDLC